MVMGLVDVWMISRLGTVPLAQTALGDLWAFGTMILFFGLIQGADPLFTQAHGAKDATTLGRTLQRGILLCLILSPVLYLCWIYADPALQWLGQDPKLTGKAADYVEAQIFSIPALLAFALMRQYLQGRGVLKPIVVTILLANVTNVIFNEVLIFGAGSIPALGIEGAGYATGASRVVMFLILAAFMIRGRHLKGGWPPWSRRSFSPRGLFRLFRFGFPVMIHFGVEVWTFQAATLMAGKLGEEALAAHVVVLKIISFTFMFPWGLSGASTTRVGNLLGDQQIEEARRTSRAALGLTAVTMLLIGGGVLLLGPAIPGIFSKDETVLAMATALLPIAAGFQLFDGIQAVSAGILRGAGQTIPAAVMGLIGFPLITLPVGYTLAFKYGWGLAGIWWGFMVGLIVAALLLTGWFVISSRKWKPLKRQLD